MLRAGPLSDSIIIKLLNEKFVNTWVFLRELPELIEGSKGKGASRIAKKLQQHYTDSVDILILTPEAEVLLHQPEMELPTTNQTQAYLTLLQSTLRTARNEKFGNRLQTY